MRPVAAPDDAVGVGGHQRLCDWRRVRKIWRLVGHAIGRRDLHVGAARADELEQGGKAGLTWPERSLDAAEMVDHHREWQGGEILLQRGNDGEAGVELDVPLAPVNLPAD